MEAPAACCRRRLTATPSATTTTVDDIVYEATNVLEVDDGTEMAPAATRGSTPNDDALVKDHLNAFYDETRGRRRRSEVATARHNPAAFTSRTPEELAFAWNSAEELFQALQFELGLAHHLRWARGGNGRVPCGIACRRAP